MNGVTLGKRERAPSRLQGIRHVFYLLYSIGNVNMVCSRKERTGCMACCCILLAARILIIDNMGGFQWQGAQEKLQSFIHRLMYH